MIQHLLAAKVFASLILLPITKAIPQRTACSAAVEAPEKSWQPGYTYSAVLAGKPLVSVPPRALGFNRTAVISSNICTPTLFPSTHFSLINGTHEFRALASAAAQAVGIQFVGASCKLSGIELRKTVQATHEVELHLQFDACIGGPTGLAVAVVMGVSSDPTGTSTSKLLPWAQELKEAAAPAPTIEISVTEKPASQISFESKEVTFKVGDGKCDGEQFDEQDIKRKATCQQKCTTANKKHEVSSSLSQSCTGFAFNEGNANKTANCILYHTTVTAIKTANDDWVCVNMTHENATIGIVEDTTTASDIFLTPSAAPPTVVSIDFTEVFRDSPMSSLTQIDSLVHDPTCFNPVWWFQLEDREGRRTSIPLKAADYEDLLRLLPEANVSEKNVSAPRVMDRVLMESCFPSEWGGTLCQVAAPKASNPLCTSDAMGNAMVTGVVTAVGTWLIVGVVFFLMSTPFRNKSQAGFNQPEEQMGEKNVCTAMTVLVLSIVAVAASVGISYGSMQLINEALRSQICYDLDEALVIMLSAMLSAGLAIVIILQYIQRRHPNHGHSLFTGSNPKPQENNHHLVLMEVPEHVTHGDRVPIDSNALAMQSSAMHSYTPQGSINGSAR